MIKDLKGNVAVVTGAASGIGLGLAEELSAEGMNVVLSDIEERGVIGAADKIVLSIADSGLTGGVEQCIDNYCGVSRADGTL